MLKNVASKFVIKAVLQSIPGPWAALIEAVSEAQSEQELSSKLSGMKSEIEQLWIKLPIVAIEIDKRLVDVVVINFDDAGSIEEIAIKLEKKFEGDVDFDFIGKDDWGYEEDSMYFGFPISIKKNDEFLNKLIDAVAIVAEEYETNIRHVTYV
ncbi:hypothetical protein [Paenibacillus senegalimassiliensis]|uniref:hypothetical protein n=1 Tax=Paenibacillus senegalimassiliensis TaxID=1737426 RepID=UPI00073EFDAA|nr:hypothetical protein [Paenibacillus senegalimassiliensis]